MPSNEGVWADDRDQIPPRDESRKEDERDARRVVRPTRSDLAFEVARELLPQEQVLGRQLRAGSAHRSQQPHQIGEQGQRRSGHVRG